MIAHISVVSRYYPDGVTVHVLTHVTATRDRSRGFRGLLPLALFQVTTLTIGPQAHRYSNINILVKRSLRKITISIN